MKKFNVLFLIVFLWSCDPCTNVTCNHGTCEEGNCICDAGWTGENCDVDLCLNVTCDHGTCVEGECECDAGWTGENCEVDMCLNVICIHGTCFEGECECNAGWEGEQCTDCLTECGDHGSCNDNAVCECDAGWTGDHCNEEVGGGETTLCTNTCEYASDGECDDGGPNSDWDLCDCGTDCDDCGTRTSTECDEGGGETEDAAISIWTSIATFPCNTQKINVYFGETQEDLEFYGYLDSYYPENDPPECGDEGTVTKLVVHGTYWVYAECDDGDVYWPAYEIDVEEGYCYILELTDSKSFSIVPKFLKRK